MEGFEARFRELSYLSHAFQRTFRATGAVLERFSGPLFHPKGEGIR